MNAIVKSALIRLQKNEITQSQYNAIFEWAYATTDDDMTISDT